MTTPVLCDQLQKMRDQLEVIKSRHVNIIAAVMYPCFQSVTLIPA